MYHRHEGVRGQKSGGKSAINTRHQCITAMKEYEAKSLEVSWLVGCVKRPIDSEGREAQFLHWPHWESNPGSLRGSPLHNRCATPAP